MNPEPTAPADTLFKWHRTDMGYTVIFMQVKDGFQVWSGGVPLMKKTGEVWVYRGLQPAFDRYHDEVKSVEALESSLKGRGMWHPIRLCAGGCGLEMRVTPREFSDGTVVTVEELLNEDRWCLSCGSERHMQKERRRHARTSRA